MEFRKTCIYTSCINLTSHSPIYFNHYFFFHLFGIKTQRLLIWCICIDRNALNLILPSL